MSTIGFVPVGHLHGSGYTGRVTKYYVPSTDSDDMYLHDLVKLTTANDASGKYQAVTLVSDADDHHVGSIVGFEFDADDYYNNTMREGGEAMYVLVADDPYTIFETTVDGTMTAGDFSLNYKPVVTGAGSPGTTGAYNSSYALDYSEKATTNTYQWRVLRAVDRPGNTLGDSTRVLVVSNVHAYSVDTGATGV